MNSVQVPAQVPLIITCAAIPFQFVILTLTGAGRRVAGQRENALKVFGQAPTRGLTALRHDTGGIDRDPDRTPSQSQWLSHRD
jgi:uncharacterized caspase-like protein